MDKCNIFHLKNNELHKYKQAYEEKMWGLLCSTRWSPRCCVPSKGYQSCNAKPTHTTCETCEMMCLVYTKYRLSWRIVQILGATVERWGSTAQFDLSAMGMVEVKIKSQVKILWIGILWLRRDGLGYLTTFCKCVNGCWKEAGNSSSL